MNALLNQKKSFMILREKENKYQMSEKAAT